LTSSGVVTSVARVPNAIDGRNHIVLTLTDSATTEIRNLIENNPEVPDDAGVRIASNPDGATLTLSLALMPAEDDSVLSENGARVFLEPTAAGLLDDKTLDAGVDPQGQVQFGITSE
jgi:iron-sulfur cluster assembly protein